MKKTLFRLGACLIFALPGPGAASAQAPTIGQLEVGDEAIPIKIGQPEALTYYVTARTRAGRLIRAPQLAFTSLDDSIVEVRGDSAIGLQSGTARVVVAPANGGKPQDTLTVEVGVLAYEAAGASAGEPLEAPDSLRSDSISPPAAPNESDEVPEDGMLGRVPAGAVLTPEPNPLSLLLGEQGTIWPVVRRQGDNGVLGNVRATWHSMSPDLVKVDSAGVVTAVRAGTGVVQVTAAGGETRTVSVKVDTTFLSFVRNRLAIPVGEQRTPMVVVPRQGNRTLDNLKLAWRSSNDTIAMVGAEGTITARAPGRAVIIVNGFALSDTLSVVVHAAVESLSVPKLDRTVAVPLGATVPHRVIPTSVEGDTIREVPISWTVDDSSIVRLDTVAQSLTGARVGTTRLSVTVEGWEPYSWTVTVVPPGIQLVPDRLALSKGERRTLRAHMVDNSGRMVDSLRGGHWQSSAPDVASVTAAGDVQGARLGRTLVSVTGPGGRSDSAEVFVVADLLVASDRAGRVPGIFQISMTEPDSLVPLVVDSLAHPAAALSPDRTRIAYATVRNRSLIVAVIEADRQGSPRTVLRTSGKEAALAWMPDGQHLVFAGGDKKRTALGLVSLERSSWDTLGVVEGEVSLSVSGEGVLAYSAGDKSRSDIFTLKPPDRVAVRLTSTPMRKWNPAWLPGGDLLYLTEDGRSKERYQVIRFSPETGSQAVVLRSELPIYSLAVSRDGQRIAYTTKGKDKQRPFRLLIRGADPNNQEREIRLRPGEEVTAPSF